MTKKFLALSAFVIALTTGALAQRIAYVDLDQILGKMKEYQDAQKQLDDLAARWRREINEDYDKIKGLYNRYQAEQVLMSDDMKKQKEEEIMQKEKEVREKQKDKFGPEGALFKKRQDLVKPIQDRVYAAIEKYAADKGYDLIMDKNSAQGIIFFSNKFDKTADILKDLGLE